MGLPVSRVTSYSQHVLWYHLVATRPQTVKSLCLSVIPGSVCWHTQYSRIYNRGKSHVQNNVNTITSIQIAEVTRLWFPINTNGKVECRNRNPNVSLTRRKKSCNMRRCSHKGSVHWMYWQIHTIENDEQWLSLHAYLAGGKALWL